MTRLPQSGKDAGTWGEILNDFLSQSHDESGLLKNNIVGTVQVQNGALSAAKLDSAVRTSLAKADSALQTAPVVSVAGQTGAITGAQLAADANFRSTYERKYVIDARDFGAMPGDATDVTAVLTAAIAAATPLGATVVIPPGRHRFTPPLILDNCHLVGTQKPVFSRSAPTTDYKGSVLVPVTATADLAAVKTVVNQRGVSIERLVFDLRNMADGSTNDPFTLAQTKGIHINGTWNVNLEDLYIIGTPSNAAAILVDRGTPPLGSFWSNWKNVFVDAYTKKGIANGLTVPGPMIEAAKDQSARGIVLYGVVSSDVTALTFVNVTTYRGLYMKNVAQFVGMNVHIEDSPAHGVYVDGGHDYTFIGGFNERAGSEALSGDVTNYRTFKGLNLPARVKTVNVTESGSLALPGEFYGFLSDNHQLNGYGFPCTVQSVAGLSATTVAWPGANRAYWWRVRDGGRINSIGLVVGTSSGNVSVSVNAGLGGRQGPGAARAVSGSVACPASGDAKISLGQVIDVVPGDWIGLSCDNTTATFLGAGPGIANYAFLVGLCSYAESAHPIGLSTPVGTNQSGVRIYALYGEWL